jgi:outer membrane receptor for ferrienterochelin and colicin
VRQVQRRLTCGGGVGVMLQNLRTTIGVALAMSLTLILVSGFFVTSRREVSLIFFGFVFGVVAVYLIERLKVVRAR